MADTETDGHWLVRLEARAVGVGALGGFLAGIAMGILFQVGTGVLPFLGAFLGETSLLLGWIVHLLISVVYGVVFTVLVAYPPIQSFMHEFRFRDYVLAGIVYATMVAAATIAVLPFVFEVPWAAVPAGAQLSDLLESTLGGVFALVMFSVAHVVYGAIVGGVYAAFGEVVEG